MIDESRHTMPDGRIIVMQIVEGPYRTNPHYPNDATSPVRPRFVALRADLRVRAPVRSVAPGCTEKPSTPDNETFHGQKREVAKTTIAAGATDPTIYSVRALRETLVADLSMKSRNPRIGGACNASRVAEESRNVTLVAYLVAVKKEGDNDYHVIVGDNGCTDSQCHMTVEVSGVPRITRNRAELKKTRDDFKTNWKCLTGKAEPPKGKWHARFPTPVRVRIEGSLFYDTEHEVDSETGAGKAGPEWARPNTAWEIHPVTNIKLDPNPGCPQ